LKGALVQEFQHTIGGGLNVVLVQGVAAERVEEQVDVVISCVGYRPNCTLWHEVQVHQCYATSGPMKLAAALMSSSGAGGDCLAQVFVCACVTCVKV